MMLSQLEDSFRCLKSGLGLRPVHHRINRRQEAHLFITVLAYHLLASIQRNLKKKGISYQWDTIRTRLSNQTRVTTSITNDKGQRIHIRQTTDIQGIGITSQTRENLKEVVPIKLLEMPVLNVNQGR
ncbi:hypothetical protein M1N92_03935 [Dehalococcoidia bacterium]|nr:hypothetical protein [Dehalococcoidia bacterium]